MQHLQLLPDIDNHRGMAKKVALQKQNQHDNAVENPLYNDSTQAAPIGTSSLRHKTYERNSSPIRSG